MLLLLCLIPLVLCQLDPSWFAPQGFQDMDHLHEGFATCGEASFWATGKFDGIFDEAEIHALLAKLRGVHGDRISEAQQIGTSVEGRPIMAYRVGTPLTDAELSALTHNETVTPSPTTATAHADPGRPERRQARSDDPFEKVASLGKGDPPLSFNVLLVGGIHGNEVDSIMLQVYTILMLLQNDEAELRRANEGTTSRGDERLLDRVRVWVVPVLNVDAYAANTATTPPTADARKNMRGNTCPSDPSKSGVDLARNYDVQWIQSNDNVLDGCDPMYRGPLPMSEPESVAIKSLVSKHGPFHTAILLRSNGRPQHGSWLIEPFSYTAIDSQPVPPRLFSQLHDAMDEGDGLSFQIGRWMNYSGDATTLTGGDLTDYLVARHGILATSLVMVNNGNRSWPVAKGTICNTNRYFPAVHAAITFTRHSMYQVPLPSVEPQPRFSRILNRIERRLAHYLHYDKQLGYIPAGLLVAGSIVCWCACSCWCLSRCMASGVTKKESRKRIKERVSRMGRVLRKRQREGQVAEGLRELVSLYVVENGSSSREARSS